MKEVRLQTIKKLNLAIDSDLPLSQRHDEIANAIQNNQVIIICGETGSGKSTQLPKICLELGRGVNGLIGHTQPRRIAARSVAARIADELQTTLGDIVGYQVRFENKSGENTIIKLMTDGILLAESQTDHSLRKYDTIIIDEAHERSLNIDFLLGIMKRILPKRQDLKLIITSATIDAERFANHFHDQKINSAKPIPVIEVAGRTYPIEILYDNCLLDELSDDQITASRTDIIWNRQNNDSNDQIKFDKNTRNTTNSSAKSVSRETDFDDTELIVAAVNRLAQHGKGDILIFLPTERDIIEMKMILDRVPIFGDDRVSQTEVLPLYSRLPVDKQQQIFQKSRNRKIVLATNVAESSLTVPGIRYVVDTGTARISRYSPRSRTQRLPIEPISQASANQRAGRCGRTGPGICIRLYSELDYLQRPKYTTPEIQRTNLASVILQTKGLKLGEIEKFPFLDPPQITSINDGYKTLYEIGAIDNQKNLTEIGRKLIKFPVDPRIARMILAAEENGVLNEMLIIAAALEIQDPRERPRENQNKADDAHEQFLNPESDFITFLNIWDFYQNIKAKTSNSSLRKSCKQNFLSFNRMKEWNDIHQQLLDFTAESNLKMTKRKDISTELYNKIHKSILTGNLSGIAERKNNIEYNSTTNSGNNNKFILWPGSGVRKLNNNRTNNIDNKTDNKNDSKIDNKIDSDLDKNNDTDFKLPHWIMAMERLETERRYLRTVARIEVDWIEQLAPHLVKRTYSQPFWNSETGYVHAFEQVNLLGIVIVQNRRVNYGTIEPEIASDIFIRQALVEGDFDSNIDFVQYNAMLLDDAKKMQAKLRRTDILLPDESRYEFYRSRIPANLVYDKRSLEKWIKSTKQDKLLMSMSDICAENFDASMFPDRIEVEQSRFFDVEYKFDPGESDDGVTIIVPQEELRQVDHAKLGWLVAGMVEQKVVAMLKTLPKDLRRQLVPIPDTAREILGRLEIGQGDIETQLAKETTKIIGSAVSSDQFKPELLPVELRMNIRVVDQDNKIIEESRNLDFLRMKFNLKETSKNNSLKSDPRWNRGGLTKWDFGDLPEFVLIDRGKSTIKAFPMIHGDSLALADSFEEAERENKKGIVRLFYLSQKRDIKTQIKWLPNIERLRIFAQPLPDFNFDEAVGWLIAARAFRGDMPIPRTADDYLQRENEGRSKIAEAVQEVTKLLVPLLTEFHNARMAIEQFRTEHAKNEKAKQACNDAKTNLLRLVESGFLINTNWQILREFPRFFKAIQIRFEKLRGGNYETIDKTNMDELTILFNKYKERQDFHNTTGINDPELEIYRWMIEEYRVSLYAQQLGTAIKVSPQRLEKQFEKIKK